MNRLSLLRPCGHCDHLVELPCVLTWTRQVKSQCSACRSTPQVDLHAHNHAPRVSSHHLARDGTRQALLHARNHAPRVSSHHLAHHFARANLPCSPATTHQESRSSSWRVALTLQVNRPLACSV
jgi:hypothetical protein